MKVLIVGARIGEIHVAQVVQTHLKDDKVGRVPRQNLREQFLVLDRAVSRNAEIEDLAVGRKSWSR